MLDMYALSASLVAALGMAAAHSLALGSAGYFRYPLLDVIMHAVGGGIIGVLAAHFSSTRPILAAAVSAFVISLVWELFELQIGMTKPSIGYMTDTVGDLFTGTAAAILVVYFMNKKHIRDEKR